MSTSSIEWTSATWNPVTGCTKVSTGCKFCYAERMALRLQAMGSQNYSDGFAVRMHEHMLDLPLRWKKPRRVFVNSMSDLFHEQVPIGFIQRVFATMNEAPRHQFQVLTKRGERLADLAPLFDWTPNIWMGVSVENDEPFNAHGARPTSRIDGLRRTPAAVKFLSCEPLLGPLDEINLDGIDWVIVGGESGPGARPMDAAWARSIRDQCNDADVAFFFKQWGGVNKKATGRLLDGHVHDEFPRELNLA